MDAQLDQMDISVRDIKILKKKLKVLKDGILSERAQKEALQTASLSLKKKLLELECSLQFKVTLRAVTL